jgi:hypothetical protein
LGNLAYDERIIRDVGIQSELISLTQDPMPDFVNRELNLQLAYNSENLVNKLIRWSK